MGCHSPLSMGFHNELSGQSVPMSLGNRIVQVREARGWSRRRLAEESGVPYPTLAGLESSDQKTSTATPMLAAALKVNALWLATGKGPRELVDDAELPPASQTEAMDAAILSRALIWLDFEARADSKPTQPLRRAQRLIALYRAIEADGGELSPDHARELIEAAGSHQQGVGKHGKGVKRNGNR